MKKINAFIENELKKPKNKLLKKCYESGDFTKFDLLYFFNNSYLRYHRLQPLRGGKRKRTNKFNRVLRFPVFKVLEETVEKIMADYLEEKFSGEFVEFKNRNK